MKVIAIAAVARNGVIGNDLELPWNIPEDMRFFRQATKGHVVLMGRKTFDSLKKPLPNRENIVVTRDRSWTAAGVRVFHDVQEAIRTLKNDKKAAGIELFVIGGAQIYAESLPSLDEVWLTEIERDYPGNIRFPDYRDGKFERPEFELVVSRPQSEENSQNDRYFFNQYRRMTALSK